MFVKLGLSAIAPTAKCRSSRERGAIAARILREYRGETVVMLAPLV